MCQCNIRPIDLFGPQMYTVGARIFQQHIGVPGIMNSESDRQLPFIMVNDAQENDRMLLAGSTFQEGNRPLPYVR